MSAKNGLTRSFRLIGCLAAVALLCSAMFASAAANAEGPPPGGPVYMALGDSISYGAQKFNENFPTESPSYFEEGLVNFFNKDLKKTDPGITPVNLACPGETSNGLIGENTALGGQVSTEEPDPPALFQGPGDWHPCAYHNVDGFPLHAGLNGKSQLENALAVLNEGKPSHPVKAITLNIGNNDVLGLLAQCKVEEPENVTGCEPGGGHYTGPIILLGAYNPLTFVSPGGVPDELAEGVNKEFVEAIAPKFTNVTVANPFPVFNKKKKGLVEEQANICKYTEECNPNVQVAGTPEGKDGDVHPSLAGYKELAKLIKKAWEANPAK